MLLHGVVLHPRVSLFSASVTETLLPFSCAGDSCFSLARGRPHDFEFCGSVFTPAAVSTAFGLALCLVVSGLDPDMGAKIDRSTCLVEPSCSLSLA